MNDTYRCAATDGGPCRRAVVMTKPVPLCDPHRIEVGLAVVPDLLRSHLIAAIAEDAAPPPRMDLVTGAAAVAHDTLLADGTHDPVVYFIANGGQVKIGYTTNLRGRLSSLTLRPDNVLLTLVGGVDLERALHARFAVHRQGHTEWFDLAPEIFRYVAGVPAEFAQAASPPAPTPAMPSPPLARRERIAPIVRRCLASDPDVELSSVLDAVRESHGVEPSLSTQATVDRTLRDERKKSANPKDAAGGTP